MFVVEADMLTQQITAYQATILLHLHTLVGPLLCECIRP
jgi:hypothetical protein